MPVCVGFTPFIVRLKSIIVTNLILWIECPFYRLVLWKKSALI